MVYICIFLILASHFTNLSDNENLIFQGDELLFLPYLVLLITVPSTYVLYK